MGYYFLKDIQYSPRLVSFEVENELRYLNPDRINVFLSHSHLI